MGRCCLKHVMSRCELLACEGLRSMTAGATRTRLAMLLSACIQTCECLLNRIACPGAYCCIYKGYATESDFASRNIGCCSPLTSCRFAQRPGVPLACHFWWGACAILAVLVLSPVVRMETEPKLFAGVLLQPAFKCFTFAMASCGAAYFMIFVSYC